MNVQSSLREREREEKKGENTKDVLEHEGSIRLPKRCQLSDK